MYLFLASCIKCYCMHRLPSGSSKKSACKSPHPLVQQSLSPELTSIKSELDGKQAGKRVSSSKTKGLSNFKMTKSFSDVASIYSNPGLLFQINPVMFLVYYLKKPIMKNCEKVTFVEFCKFPYA